MKRFWRGERKHIDEEKVAAEKRELANLERLKVLGDEEAFAAFSKLLNPDISREELRAAILVFREQHQEYLRGVQRRP